MSPGIHSKIGIPDNSITVESCSRERETKSNKKKRRKRHQAAKLLLRKSMGGGQRHCCSSRIFYPVVCRCTPRNVQIKRKDVIKTSVCVTNWITATEARTMGKKINKQTNKSNRWWAEHEKKWRSCKSVWLVHTHIERRKKKKSVVSRMSNTTHIMPGDFSSIELRRETSTARRRYIYLRSSSWRWS